MPLPPGPPTADFASRMLSLRQRLARPLPGESAMMAMMPSKRPFVRLDAARDAGCREACTLVLLYPHGGRAHLVLTVRTGELRDHAGQVSLPGGSIDPGEDVTACALREAREELGIDVDAVEVMGRLTALYIAPTDFCMSPTVASLSERPEFDPHDGEVAELLEVPVCFLTDESNRRVETWVIRNEEREVPFYLVDGQKVWGATAMVLSELASVWRDIEEGNET